LTLDAVACIQQGVPWRDLKVRQGDVLYIAAEGAGGFRNRLVAYQQQRDVDLAHMQVLAAAPNLLKADEVKGLIATVKSLPPVSVIVVDTLAQTTPGADENSAEGMGKALASCKALHKATGATILLIHHAGKDASKGLRGWSGFDGMCDAVIEVTRDGDRRAATVRKLKDGQDGAVYPFKLVVVPIGKDEDGDVIDSCVVEHLDSGVNGGQSVAVREPSGSVEILVLKEARELCGLGEPSVTVQTLIDAAVRVLPFTEGQEARRPFRVRRALELLQAKGYLSTRDGVITLGAVR
jgi:hypothetical protein